MSRGNAAMESFFSLLKSASGMHPWASRRFVAAGPERALRDMWRRWCDGLPAVPFQVELRDLVR
ncbi:MAG: hypothetical protein QOF14_4339 [Hyphomicrobiales bacterium]|jgi:hypothetical protein|nr:hypothetical protein [Hyphomicrobiales bacterium]